MFLSFEPDNKYQTILIAIILAVTLGIIISLFFIVADRNSYSSIYLVPDSILHTNGDEILFFEYGVKSSEVGKMDYTLNTYLNGENINTKQFSLNPEEILEERQVITLPPGTQYPSKISLKLITKSQSEEVHFWLK